MLAQILSLSLLIGLAASVVREQKRVLCLHGLLEQSFAKSTPLLLETSKRVFPGRSAPRLPRSIAFISCNNPYRLAVGQKEVQLEITKVTKIQELRRSKESRTPQKQRILGLHRE